MISETDDLSKKMFSTWDKREVLKMNSQMSFTNVTVAKLMAAKPNWQLPPLPLLPKNQPPLQLLPQLLLLQRPQLLLPPRLPPPRRRLPLLQLLPPLQHQVSLLWRNNYVMLYRFQFNVLLLYWFKNRMLDTISTAFTNFRERRNKILGLARRH